MTEIRKNKVNFAGRGRKLGRNQNMSGVYPANARTSVERKTRHSEGSGKTFTVCFIPGWGINNRNILKNVRRKKLRANNLSDVFSVLDL